MLSVMRESHLRLGDTEELKERRRRMVRKQILARGVTDPAVLRAMEEVPRHRFVEERFEGYAYDDSPVPIPEGQTISQPFIVAYMTAALELKGNEKVLEVGTGSGYQAAVLAEIVREVYTIEINPNLAIEAAQRFKKMGYTNIFLKCGDGYQGWPEAAPFDGILVTAAPDHIPPRLIEQLRPGGKMVIPVGDDDQELLVVYKREDGSIHKEARIPVRFVPMLRQAENSDE